MSLSGSCLCGQVRYQAEAAPLLFRYCFCPRCRKKTGAAHATNIFIPPDGLIWLSGEALIKRFDLPEAKSFATSFCTHCGSPVPHRTRNGSYMCIPAGSLDNPLENRPMDGIYWEARAPWYVQPNDICLHAQGAP